MSISPEHPRRAALTAGGPLCPWPGDVYETFRSAHCTQEDFLGFRWGGSRKFNAEAAERICAPVSFLRNPMQLDRL